MRSAGGLPGGVGVCCRAALTRGGGRIKTEVGRKRRMDSESTSTGEAAIVAAMLASLL